MAVEFTSSADDPKAGMTVPELKLALDLAEIHSTLYIKHVSINWGGRLKSITFSNQPPPVSKKRSGHVFSDEGDDKLLLMDYIDKRITDRRTKKTDEEIDEEFGS
jgi:hypothetical protein